MHFQSVSILHSASETSVFKDLEEDGVKNGFPYYIVLLKPLYRQFGKLYLGIYDSFHTT